MKLYTEETIKAIGEWASQWDLYELDKEVNFKPPMFKEFINSLTPIELPSDEEIRMQTQFATHDFYFGAKWMKKQILNQNK